MSANSRWYVIAAVVFLVLAVIGLVRQNWVEAGLWLLVAGGLGLSPLGARPGWAGRIKVIQTIVLLAAIALLAARLWWGWGLS
jgi:hypothetical protein